MILYNNRRFKNRQTELYHFGVNTQVTTVKSGKEGMLIKVKVIIFEEKALCLGNGTWKFWRAGRPR